MKIYLNFEINNDSFRKAGSINIFEEKKLITRECFAVHIPVSALQNSHL